MTAASTADILIAASEVDDRLLECLADCRATLVRTFDEAQRALRDQLFRMVVIDLNFDNVRMFDLLQHIRSLAQCSGVPVLCVQGAEPAAGLGAALDRLVRKLGGEGLVDLRGQAAASAILLRRPSIEAQAAARLCILIVDHDVDAAHRLGEIVEQAGHEVDFAYSGAAGLDAARRLRPDVVFLDIRLRIGGRLRRDAALRSLTLVALTGAETDPERVRAAGFDHCIAKPVSQDLVRGLLAQWPFSRPASRPVPGTTAGHR
jgi:DNA-binding response OmpR family regulator